MTNEHTGTHIYDKGRFELRETDNAIIDLKGDFPPIMIVSNTVDDGSEPNCADKRSVLHLLNELADNNPNEERHWYLKKMLDKSWKQYYEQKDENEQLKQSIKRQQSSNNECAKLIQEQQKENEQLKQQIEKLFCRERGTKNEWRELKQENERLRKALDEADDLIKSHLSSHYNRKWENYLEYLGVDLK